MQELRDDNADLADQNAIFIGVDEELSRARTAYEHLKRKNSTQKDKIQQMTESLAEKD